MFTSVYPRVFIVTRILEKNVDIRLAPVLRCKSDDVTVRINDVSRTIKPAKNSEYVPRKYLLKEPSQATLKHLRWMLQKDILGQDIFLIGGPGSRRRNIALAYLELTGQEVEFISLSRDTTEADLKQRREIENGTANYHDQSAVRAAKYGRVLILEGVEKAERNVLPVLNNLLENREMHLEDGRFLIPASRYDKLLREHRKEELDAWRLVRVSEDFRVIALGLPSPRYPGHPLDPPLRSRFQARHITPPTFQEQLETLKSSAPNADVNKVSKLLSCCHALVSKEAVTLGLPDFPLDNLTTAATIFESCPNVSVYDVFYRFYPYKLFLGKEGKAAVEGILDTFGVLNEKASLPGEHERILDIQKDNDHSLVTLNKDGDQIKLNVPSGSRQNEKSRDSEYVETKYQNKVLSDVMLSHASTDYCIVGPKGCGKSTVVGKIAESLGYEVEPIVLYQDMTSRDLIQQRSTKLNGDTVWKDSALITAALKGKMAVLDGIHRVHSSTLAVLYRLVHDREIQLHDGKRLMRADRYDEMKTELGKTDEEIKESGILRIHPSFKLVGLAERPLINSSSGQWLNSELLSLFNFHEMRALDKSEEIHIIKSKFGKPSEALMKIIELAHKLRSSNDPTLQSLAGSLSTRQLLRIAAKMHKFPSADAYGAVHRAVLARFLPTVPKQALEDCMEQLGIHHVENKNINDIKCSVEDKKVSIGKTVVDRYETGALTKVPDILFYDVPQHLVLLESLLQDFVLGQNILLVGNQGVGKNKIVDRLLQLMNRPREYIQLHRDTTVQTLTLQSMVRDGIVVYEDSPLVQAVRLGHVLVIDEADKAPTHVTCILKTLAESGEMILSDGRRILPASRAGKNIPNIIPIHQDFRMIVLANRPGFPFLGNDFFGALGDLFSTHSVDNPDLDSEISLLKQYGPDVDDKVIRKLVKAFGELRSMADQGLVSYPYSTREVVNIVKHIQKFPDEPLITVVKNVFDFDRYTPEVYDTLVTVLHKHGIPIGTSANNVSLAKEFPLPDMKYGGTWNISASKAIIPVQERFIKLKSPVDLEGSTSTLDRMETRSGWFTEMQSYSSIPLSESGYIAAVAVTKSSEKSENDQIHVLSMNPSCVSTMTPNSDKVDQILLKNLLNPNHINRPQFMMFPDKSGNLIIHEKITNSLVTLNIEKKNAQVFQLSSFFETASEKLSHALGTRISQWKLIGDLISSQNQAIFYTPNHNKIEVLNLNSMSVYSMSLPIEIESILLSSPEKWLIQDKSRKTFVLEKLNEVAPCPNVLRQVETSVDQTIIFGMMSKSSEKSLGNEILSKALGQKIVSPNRLLTSEFTYAGIIVGFPDLNSSNEVHFWPRKGGIQNETSLIIGDGQVVCVLPSEKVPDNALVGDRQTSGISNYLEVVDVANRKVRYLPIPSTPNVSPTIEWSYPRGLPVYLASTSDEGLVTVDVAGSVRLWETSTSNIEKSLLEWQKMVGSEDEHLQVTKERYSGLDTKAPKHGKIDPKNEPHVGGNTWAGGTGGRDTAGLGGKGGPYRLDAGHTVHQLSDEEKNNVPEHVKKAAREMGLKAFKQRLRDIHMSEYDHKLYSQFSDAVSKQVKSLRVILGSLQANSNERQWLKHQTSGELDDTKLIEGLTGEKTIYRRRAEKEPEIGAPQLKPKRLKLVVDVSGSMYRFNGYDGRLDRELEACVMVMEAFYGYEGKIQYDIVGHSGDEFRICFVDHNQPPADNKQRLEVVKSMHAHSQYCMSGDHTLEATQHAISSLSKEDTDESIVVVLSDANLERYGIPPEKFGKLLTSCPEVNAYAIFIGSLGDQATRIMQKMPSGRAYVCMDLKNIPRILQQIFASSVLSTKSS